MDIWSSKVFINHIMERQNSTEFYWTILILKSQSQQKVYQFLDTWFRIKSQNYSQTHWPAHIRKPDGKINNLTLGSDYAFQILRSVIRNQLQEFSNGSKKRFHIKNGIEYHHISHQTVKRKGKCKFMKSYAVSLRLLHTNQSLCSTTGLQVALDTS